MMKENTMTSTQTMCKHDYDYGNFQLTYHRPFAFAQWIRYRCDEPLQRWNQAFVVNAGTVIITYDQK